MKDLFVKIIFFALSLVSLSNCNKIGRTYDAYFYTHIEHPSGPVFLDLDEVYNGALPLLKTPVSVNNDTILNNALHLRLKAGKYKIKVRDSQGNIKCSGVLKFRLNSFNGATNPGVLEHAMNNKVIVTRILYE